MINHHKPWCSPCIALRDANWAPPPLRVCHAQVNLSRGRAMRVIKRNEVSSERLGSIYRDIHRLTMVNHG